MSRDDGWATADVDTGYFEDAKLRDLWRLLLDDAKMAHAVCLHQATLLASWRQGCRVTVNQASPLWLTPDVELLKALRKAQLLDRGGRIPATSWAQWYEVAEQRRAARRQAGAIGGAASALSRTTDGPRKPKQPLTDAGPVLSVRPSVPTVRPAVPREDGGEDMDPADAYWSLTGSYPNDKARDWIDDLTETYGAAGVIAAMAAECTADPSGKTLIGRVKTSLQREARRLDRQEQEAAKAKIVEMRRPTVLRHQPEEISPEEADRIAREYMAEGKARREAMQ